MDEFHIQATLYQIQIFNYCLVFLLFPVNYVKEDICCNMEIEDYENELYYINQQNKRVVLHLSRTQNNKRKRKSKISQATWVSIIVNSIISHSEDIVIFHKTNYSWRKI